MSGIENLLGRNGRSTVLGLAFDGSRLDGVVLKRPNGSLQVLATFSVTLSLDPLTAAPELVGREIRNHLDAAGVRERNCVVGIPLKWALTAQTELPDLPEADIPEFLQLEAERGFHADVETLQFAASRFQAGGKKYATLIGIPRTHVERLEEVLHAAKLKPVSFTLAIAALQPPAAGEGLMTLAIGETHVGLQVACGGGIAALRALEGAAELAGSRRVLHADLVARETRITLGQLPGELRDSIRRVRIFGPRDLGQQLADEMELRFEAMNLQIDIVSAYAPKEFGLDLPPDAAVSRELSLAARYLAGKTAGFEFLPPKISAWQQLANRYSSGPLRTAGAVAGAVLGLALLLFGFQQWKLSSLQSRWNRISGQVAELGSLQEKIQQFRPWYDESAGGLSILRQLTLAFPEDNAVSAKTVEIRDLNAVTCTGTARDNQSFLATIGRLRGADGISAVKVDQIRGKTPLQFSFDFRWNGGSQ
jgi:Tfp pilus assembly PilM family ATPase